MKTLTSKTKIGNELEEMSILYATNDHEDTPRPDQGDETIDPNKPKKPKDPSEEKDGEVRPYEL